MASIFFGNTIDLSNSATPSNGAYLVAYDLDGVLKQMDEFGVITEIGGGVGASSLSDILGNDNDSGVNDIIMGTSTSIYSSNGGAELELDRGGVNNTILLSSDGTELQQGLLLDQNNNYMSIFSNGYSQSILLNDGSDNINIYNTVGDITIGVDSSSFDEIRISNNSSGTSSSNNNDKKAVFIGTRESLFSPGVINSVIIGGQSIIATQSNYVYVGGNLNINNSYTFPNTDGATGQSILSDGLGNLYWGVSSIGLSDVLLVGNNSGSSDIIMGTSTSILSSNGDSVISLDYLGNNNNILISSTTSTYMSMDSDITLDTEGVLNIGASAANIVTDNLQGLVYGFDYSSTFVDNSLISKLYVDSAYLPLIGGTISGDLIINGDIIVSGTQTIINTENLYVEDNIITLNATYSGPPVIDAGIEVNLGDGTYSNILWDSSAGYWGVGLSGSESTIVTEAGDGLTKSNNQLEVDFGTVSSISYVDSGTSSIWTAINNIGGISDIIAGVGLTGGGSSSVVTLNTLVNNGLSISSNNIGLGGTLSTDTNIYISDSNTLSFQGASGSRTTFTQTAGGNTITQGVGTNPVGFSSFGDVSYLTTSGQYDLYGGYFMSGSGPAHQSYIFDNTTYIEQSGVYSGVSGNPFTNLYYISPSNDFVGFEANSFGERILSQSSGLNIISPLDKTAGITFLSGAGGTGYIGVTNQRGFLSWMGNSLKNSLSGSFLETSGGTMSGDIIMESGSKLASGNGYDSSISMTSSIAFNTGGVDSLIIGSMSDVEVTGYTKLGSDAPSIKTKLIKYTTPSFGLQTQNLPHNIVGTIISYDIICEASDNKLIKPFDTTTANSNYTAYITTTDYTISSDYSSNGNISNSVVSFFITYTE